jgi:hypothetical protein
MHCSQRYFRENFHSLVAHDEPMYAANGARMTIGGLGTAGPFSDVLFLPDLRVNLISRKQAMRDGSRITLSPDAQIFTVVLPPNRTLKCIFDGTFWIWDDDSQFLRPDQMEQSLAVISAAEPTDHADWPMAATISHSGAVQEFLMLHFRLGHLNYTAMLRALQAMHAGFQHSFQNIHLEQLPRCSVCLRMKNKHLPISIVGRFVQPRPGLLFHMDLKTVRTRLINHEHYIVDIIDDNSAKPWIYCQEVRRLRHGSASIREHCVQASRDPLLCSADRQRWRADIARGPSLLCHERHPPGSSACLPPRIQQGGREVLRHSAVQDSLHAGVYSHAGILVEPGCSPRMPTDRRLPKGPRLDHPDWKWDGSLPDVSGFRTFGCRVYTHVNREIGTLDARGEEMRYLGCSHDSHFHHLYCAHDRRVFTTDDVTFVETDIQLPDYSGNMEIELAGQQRLTEDEQRQVDAHAERDDEVNWDQLQIPEQAELEADDDVVPPSLQTSVTARRTRSHPSLLSRRERATSP